MKKIILVALVLGLMASVQVHAGPVRRPVDVVAAKTKEIRRSLAAEGIWGYADFFATVGGVTFVEPFDATDWIVLGTVINNFITSGATPEEQTQNAIIGLTASANLTLYKNLLSRNGGDPGRIFRP